MSSLKNWKTFPLLVLLLLMTYVPSLQSEEVLIFAASSLTEALQEASALYEKQTGDHVTASFAASSTLVAQIKAGATADIFFSADEAKMNDLDKLNLIVKTSRLDLLSNSLVIVVPTESAVTFTSAQQLVDPRVRKLALGQPQSVPAGIYAREYLQKIGLWTQLSDRVVPMENVRATLAAVETGNADAAIVYKSDVKSTTKVKLAYEIPVTEGPSIAYPIALLTAGRHPDSAQKFVKFLTQPETLKIFAKWGFMVKS